MKRRQFIGGLTGAAAVSACQPAAETGTVAAGNERFEWKLVTTWPPNFPGLGTGVNTLVDYIQRMSAGRIRIHVYAANELVPALEVFDTVSRGTAEIGHGASYYWRGQSEAAQFFCSIPFGMNAHEMNGWLYYGGGLELWREIYEPFNLMPFPAGNTGVQMGGWFNKRIDSIADLQGLKMRIPGVGGEVLKLAGGTPVTLAGSEIFTALQTGSIDATEWVGPYNDVAMGLHQVARYYYYPGWQEPGPTLECIINRGAWDTLPDDLKAIVEVACQATNMDMTSEYMARNAAALKQLEANPDVEVLGFPEPVLENLKRLTSEFIVDLAAKDARVQRVWNSYRAFLEESATWQKVSEQAYLATRD
jgi:TRAP-type mannitol/chloroaromatic compound transport system substrate-binding protein